jgi:peptide/nickel transport system permease protein
MKEVLKDLIKHKIGFISLLIIFILVILAMFAPYLFPYDPFEINENEILLPPSLKHPLGTDLLERMY